MNEIEIENENENDEELEQDLEPEDLQEQEPEVLEPENLEAEDLEADKLKELEQELAAARADFYNYRQRVAKEKQEMRKRIQDDVVIALLPVLDNLDRALSFDVLNAGQAGTPEDDGSRNVLIGVRMVQQQFLMSLNELGVSVIKTEHEKFDHNLHEAVGTVEVEDEELDGVIIAEQLKGYKSGDKVLRAARVLVGKFIKA